MGDPRGPGATTPTVTLHSSWRGIVVGSLGAAIIAAAGTFGVVSVGFRAVPTVLFVIGWGLVLAVVLDYPVAATFSADGVQRRMPVRRQWFGWDDDTYLTRGRPSPTRVDRRLEHGALTLVRGRRRYLLVDRLESADEFDELVEVVEAAGGAGEEVGVSMLPRPGHQVPPTWLYRRRQWRPESATGR